MTKLSVHALKAAASGLILAAALGCAAPAFAQDGQFPPPTTPLGGNGQVAEGIGAPNLKEPKLGAPPPAFFCSERDKLDFLLKHVYPPAQQASKNNIAAHDYLVKIRRLRDASTGFLQDIYSAEFNDWEPKWRKHEETLQTFLKILDAVRAIPVIDCRGAGIAALPPGGGGVDVRPEPDKAAQLAAAMESKPTPQVAGGSYADFGLRSGRPFDGSEAETALRDRLKIAAEYRHERDRTDHDRTSAPTYEPFSSGPISLNPVVPLDLGVSGAGFSYVPEVTTPPTESDGSWEATIPFGPSTGMTSLEPPPPPPAVQGHTLADPPVVSSGPVYPDCPTHPGMPGSPEHIREFHS